MGYEALYSVVIILVIVILIKMAISKERINSNKIDKAILVRYEKGIKNITMDELVNIIYKFKNNIKRCATVVDDENCSRFHDLARESKKSVARWIAKQDESIFAGSLSKQRYDAEIKGNLIEAITDKIATLSEVTGTESRSDMLLPNEKEKNKISPIESKSELLSLANDLHMLYMILNKVYDIKSSKIVLDIRPIEKIMNDMGKTILSNKQKMGVINISKNTPTSATFRRSIMPHIRLVKSKFDSHSGDLKYDDRNTSNIICRKSKGKRHCYLDLAGIAVDNRRNITL